MRKEEFQTGTIKAVECFKEGWAAIKPHYWLIFAITIVGFLIGGLSMYVLLGSMVCGVFHCYFRLLDGKETGLEHLFRGFRYFWPSFFVVIVMMAPTVILIGLIYVPLLLATFSGAPITEDELFALLSGTLVIEFIVAVIMVCIHTLMMFSFPLIVDRGLSGWQSIIVSAKAVLKNLKGVTGLWAVRFVAALAGYLALCVGIYFVIAVILAANIAAYRKVFPKLEKGTDGPPPPDAYSSALS